MPFDYDYSKAIGLNADWNALWMQKLAVNTTEFSVVEIEKQYEDEWNEWIKMTPNDPHNKRKLLWDKAISNYIDKIMQSDFVFLFGSSLIPEIIKKKNRSLIVNGIIIEKFLTDIKEGKGIIRYTGKNQEAFLLYMEFLARGMEKTKFSC